MKRIASLILLIGLLAACGSQATPSATPDAVATQVAVLQAAAATLTAQAPAATVTQAPEASATATQAPPSATATSAPPTAIVVPSATLPAPSATMAPAPTATRTQAPPTEGPSLGAFAVAGVYAGDVLNVRVRPGAGQPVAGTIPYFGRGVQVYAGEQEVGGATWVHVRYGGVSGWSNRSFLARQVGDASDALAMATAQAVLALRDHDMVELASLVHPVKGVTFSPYTFVRTLQGAPGEADLVFARSQVAGLWSDPTLRLWGAYDGSGEPIELTFQAYYTEFVYDVDFAQPEEIGFDEFIGQGNTINNIREACPLGVPVEYYFSGFDPQYGGMDWRSLRLVWEQVDGTWYLVGIVHDEWTI